MSIFQKTKQSVMEKSRSAKLDHFFSLCTSQSSVLDVGVADNENFSSTNMLLNRFRYDDDLYTGLSIHSMEGMRQKHPNKRFVEYGGGIFPFADDEFDWVFSNAVVEHVGNRTNQLMFINEMLRVGKRVFFTTPNRWFPIESHTNALFRHWFARHFDQWCKKNHPYWNRDNLHLFGKGDLKRLLELSSADRYIIHNNLLLGWPMTFTVVC